MAESFRLSDFIFMMREHVIDAADVDVNGLAEDVHRLIAVSGAVTDGVMQPTAPAAVIVPSTIVISGDIAVGRHGGNFRTCPAGVVVLRKQGGPAGPQGSPASLT